MGPLVADKKGLQVGHVYMEMNINFYFLLEVVVKDKISKECKNLFKIASKGSETMSTLSFIVKDSSFTYIIVISNFFSFPH